MGRRYTARMFAAVLDTSVLWPSRQRDFLLSLAIEGLYRPLWSDAILEELEFHEAAKLEGRGSDAIAAAAAAARLIVQMRRAFDDAVVADWEPLDGSYGLPGGVHEDGVRTGPERPGRRVVTGRKTVTA